jgi:hypothetical protein
VGRGKNSMLESCRRAVGDWINSKAEHHVFQKIGM